MDSRTGDLYRSVNAALRAGVNRDDIVTVSGSAKAIERLSLNVRRGANIKKARRDARRRARGFIGKRVKRP